MKMRWKKAQAAMEFLMTYGWAILVVLVAIAALSYFGVINPSGFLPNNCILIPGLACTAHKVDTTSVTLVIQNGIGQTLDPFTVTINSESSGYCVGDSASDPDGDGLKSGEEDTFVITCTTPPVKDEKFKAELLLNYTSKGLSHTGSGQMIAKVE